MGTRAEARDLIDRLAAAYNARRVDELVSLYHEDVRYWSSLGGWQDGIAEVRRHLEELHEALPDEQMEPLTVITDGDVIVVEFASSGTTPRGDAYRIEFTEVFELEHGKIRTIRVYLDPEEVEALSS